MFKPLLGLKHYIKRLSFIVGTIDIYAHACPPTQEIRFYQLSRSNPIQSCQFSWISQAFIERVRNGCIYLQTPWSRPAHPSHQSPWVIGWEVKQWKCRLMLGSVVIFMYILEKKFTAPQCSKKKTCFNIMYSCQKWHVFLPSSRKKTKNIVRSQHSMITFHQVRSKVTSPFWASIRPQVWH